MEPLDLTRHDPEEWEGKTLLLNGCEYLIGRYLGTGAERIVHLLTNRRSGLTLHVLKIWRGPIPLAPSEVRKRLVAGDPSFAKIIPISIEVELPGGQAEVQEYAGGGPRPPAAPGDALTIVADTLLAADKHVDAIAAYKAALAENTDHTHALINLAASLSQSGDLSGAQKAALRATMVEPNFLLYHRALIGYLGDGGLVRLALLRFRQAKKICPNTNDLCELGARLFLLAGEPKAALAEAEVSVLIKTEKSALLETTIRAIEACDKAHAFAEEARPLIETEPARALELLRQAHRTSPNDPRITMNLAFALARAGERRDAVPLLLIAASRGPESLAKSCYLNAALCESDRERAMHLLAATMTNLDAEHDGREPRDLLFALPGPGVWVSEDQIVERALDAAADLVAQITLAQGKDQAPLPDAQRLARLYAKAVGRTYAPPEPMGAGVRIVSGRRRSKGGLGWIAQQFRRGQRQP
jgi:tetratricopeptide (TPR) repeat protein